MGYNPEKYRAPLANGTRRNAKTRVNVALDHETFAQIRRIAQDLDEGMSQTIAHMLAQSLKSFRK